MSEPTFSHDELRSDRRSFLKMAGIGGAVLVAAGCDSADTPDPIDPGTFAGLMGTVTTEDGVPLADVVVTVDETSRTATTDANGNYAIENLPTGTYTVRANGDNFAEGEAENVVIADGSAGTADLSLSPGGNIVFDFADDFGPLNYAYALEQLEAAFYETVVAAPDFATIFSAEEQAIMLDLAAHEGIHRDLFFAAISGIGGTPANRDLIPMLVPNFDRPELGTAQVDFSSRESVLATAQVFEDLGVGAYNGAGRSFSDTPGGAAFLTLAGKIVSVEARHASVVAQLLSDDGSIPLAADDVIDASGLDQALAPIDVLAAAAPYLVYPDEGGVVTGLQAINA
ncbi:MAG: ferritin-like domain-containing protein [Bacteroidota bacterium]